MSRFNPESISCRVYMGPGSRLSYDLCMPGGGERRGDVNSWPLCEEGYNFLWTLARQYPVGHEFESIQNMAQLYAWLNSHLATGDYFVYGQP